MRLFKSKRHCRNQGTYKYQSLPDKYKSKRTFIDAAAMMNAGR